MDLAEPAEKEAVTRHGIDSARLDQHLRTDAAEGVEHHRQTDEDAADPADGRLDGIDRHPFGTGNAGGRELKEIGGIGGEIDQHHAGDAEDERERQVPARIFNLLGDVGRPFPAAECKKGVAHGCTHGEQRTPGEFFRPERLAEMGAAAAAGETDPDDHAEGEQFEQAEDILHLAAESDAEAVDQGEKPDNGEGDEDLDAPAEGGTGDKAVEGVAIFCEDDRNRSDRAGFGDKKHRPAA